MPADLAGRLDLAPQLRMASFAYREVFGRPPAVVWQVPGPVTLLASGPLRLTVAARWGAVAAAAPRPDDVVELIRVDRPAEPARLTVAQATAGGGPSWAGSGLRSARAGATVLVSIGAPAGSGLGVAAAAETAIGLCLQDVTASRSPDAEPDPALSAPRALLGDRRLPFDLDAAGLRLAVIDTRVRGVPQPPATERAPVEAAAAALNAGDFRLLGALLTASHRTLPRDDVQEIAVSAALAAGALGARAITDGPGRPACALLPAVHLADVRAALLAAFTRRGFRTPRLLTISPADGPRRVNQVQDHLSERAWREPAARLRADRAAREPQVHTDHRPP
jgi:galactokinase